MIKKFICIHAHFYQPPRENPWLDEVEFQESAFPHHDWNDKITLECYGPNLAARVVDFENNIIDLVNNYQNISFNFGPTLFNWMEKKQKYIYENIINSDKKNNRKIFNSAIAQCYNHIIMPLANKNDKETQIIWGIKDFEYRFKRKPKGMWLPETAVDLKTLNLMRKHGIEFIILSPFQAHKLRYKNSKIFKEVFSSIDTRRPYYIKLDNDEKISVFFYNGSIASDMAFKNLLSDSERLYQRFIKEFSNTDKVELVNVALDGETFGHHKKFADMALGSFIKKIEREKNISFISYEEFLNLFEPEDEVTIIENSAWSCAHGVGRWSYDCGCSVSQRKDLNQKWRKPLLEAMKFLRDKLFDLYLEKMKKFSLDPIRTRNEYIDIILNQDNKNIEKFIKKSTSKELSSQEKTIFLKLLSMQKYSMSMFTSCGWFFDDLLNIETLQIIFYATKAIDIAKQIFNVDLKKSYLEILQKAKSNENKDGKQIYLEKIESKILNLKKIAIFFSICSLFKPIENLKKYYSYDVKIYFHQHFSHSKKHLSFAHATLSQNSTLEKIDFYFAAIHLEDQNLIIGITEQNVDIENIKKLFFKDNIDELKCLLNKNFEIFRYSFFELLIDDRREIVNEIFFSSSEKIYQSIKSHYEKHYSLINEMHKKNMPLSKSFLNSLNILLNQTLLNEIKKIHISKIKKLTKIVYEILKWNFEIDIETIYFLKKNLEDFMLNFQKDVKIDTLKSINHLFEIFKPFNLDIHFWKIQNIYFDIFKKNFKNINILAKEKKQESALEWIKEFDKLQKYLKIKLF